MRVIPIVVVAAWMSTASAQRPAAPNLKTFASSTEVQDLIAHAKKLSLNGQPLISQPILQLAPYRASLEYRDAVGVAAIHEKEAEIFYVIDGTGTLVSGGKLVNEKRTDAANLSGTAIDGGGKQALAKGDFVIVPENTAHWFSEIKGELILVSLHVPRTTEVK